MPAVLATPPFLAFYDDNGNPLSGGKVFTYVAATNTPKATYTDSTGLIASANPIILDSAGRAVWFLIGSYKYVITDSTGTIIRTVDNVTSFSTLADSTSAFFQTFSGNGTTTAFTLSSSLGTDSKNLMVFVNRGLQTNILNGTFTTDTDWTKGAGWTIAAGLATATGAISTALSQTASPAFIQGQAYAVTYTVTAVSAGSVTASIGGNAGTARTTAATFTEIIIAGSNQTIAFTGAGFTGSIDNVTVSVANSAGYDILAPTAYTLSGTALTFATAPATGTNNIYVFAPSQLLGAASSAADSAAASAAAAATSQTAAAISASSAAGYAAARNQWTFSTTTTMANPTTGNLRFNNATIASATQIAISDFSSNVGNPDLSAWIATWDDAGGANRGSIFIFVDNANFAIFNVNSTLTDNVGWFQIPVTYVAGAGTISNAATILIGFAASGTTIVTGGITALTGDVTATGTGSVITTINSPVGAFVSSFRNQSFVIAQRGTSGTVTAGIPSYTLDGWRVSATGANIIWAQGNNITNYVLNLGCGTGITAASVGQRIESIVAAALSSRQVTVQFQIQNTTGASFTPTLTVNRANVADNFGAVTIDVNAVTLQACPNGATTTVAYTFAANVGSGTGLEVILNLGAALNQTAGGGIQVQISKADIRVTNGASTGINNSPPFPEFRQIQAEYAYCSRYFFSTFPVGITPAQNAGLAGAMTTLQGFGATVANQGTNELRFPSAMRATPTIITYNPQAANAQIRNITRAADVSATAANIVSALQTSFTYTTAAGSATGDTNMMHLTASAEL
jgi:hypothetical protein